MIREQVLGIVAMEPMGEYSANVKYEKLNIVTYNGSTYSALGDTLGNEPTNKEYWQLIAKKGDKGDSYVLTDEDKENIKNDITENANSDFNKNVEEKTTTFDNHVTEKTSSFNTNVENKIKEFNDNSTTKLEKFNTNSTNKLEEYNTNANAKLNEYNANADGVMTIAVDTRNELERVKNDVLETGEASGGYLSLNDSTMAELQELEVNSIATQDTTIENSPSPDNPQEIPMITTDSVLKSIGKNLYNYKDMELLHNKITQDEEGWMTANYDNTNGASIVYLNCYSKNLKLFPNTQYNIFIEVKNVEGAGQLFPCSAHNATQNNEGQFITSSYFKFSELSNGIIKNLIGTTRNSLEGVTRGLRTFLQFGAGEKGSITFRLSVLADTTIKPDTFTYEPYQESILNMPIPEGEFVGYINDNAKDKFRVGYNEEDGNYHLYLDKMLGKVILNGSESWLISTTKDITQVFEKGEILPQKSYSTYVCDRFLYNNQGDVPTLKTAGMNGKNTFIAIEKTKASTVSEFKAWLSENNTTICYELENPYTLDLGIVDMPLSYDGVTNIFVDTDLLMNINTKYYRNFTETVRNLQINNDTLKNELASIESRLSALETSRASVVSESEVVE